MSVLLTYQKVSPDTAWVNGRVYQVEKGRRLMKIDELSAEEQAQLNGLIIDEELIPDSPEVERGRSSRLMFNFNTGELYWETRERQLSAEELQQITVEKLDQIIELLSNQK